MKKVLFIICSLWSPLALSSDLPPVGERIYIIGDEENLEVSDIQSEEMLEFKRTADNFIRDPRLIDHPKIKAHLEDQKIAKEVKPTEVKFRFRPAKVKGRLSKPRVKFHVEHRAPNPSYDKTPQNFHEELLRSADQAIAAASQRKSE